MTTPAPTAIVAFLRARYDEREQAARHATWCEEAGTWRAEVSPYRYLRKSSDPRWYVEDSLDDAVIQDVHPQASDNEGVARHIALNDPAYVLADVDAKRRILDEAANYSPELEHGDNGEWAFGAVLRLLALPFAAHPDYREEWKP